MGIAIESVFISPSPSAEEPSDVIVDFNNRSRYVASFFPFESVERIRADYEQINVNLNGTYFWAKNMVLVRNCERRTILRVIEYMLEEGEFQEAFEKI